jgi:hypothetical protein
MTEQTSTGDLFATAESNIRPLTGMGITGDYTVDPIAVIKSCVKCLVALGAKDRTTES